MKQHAPMVIASLNIKFVMETSIALMDQMKPDAVRFQNYIRYFKKHSSFSILDQHGCEPNEFRCANKRCILKTWRCDSDDDCGDNSDEENCATNPPGSPCRYNEFQCRSGNQCIPKSFHCDLERDCVDGSDEIGCCELISLNVFHVDSLFSISAPVYIQKPPPPMITLDPGALFEISCTAVGTPTPEVVWRLNWGHIPEKCTTRSENGVGVLTCPNIQVLYI